MRRFARNRRREKNQVVAIAALAIVAWPSLCSPTHHYGLIAESSTSYDAEKFGDGLDGFTLPESVVHLEQPGVFEELPYGQAVRRTGTLSRQVREIRKS